MRKKGLTTRGKSQGASQLKWRKKKAPGTSERLQGVSQVNQKASPKKWGLFCAPKIVENKACNEKANLLYSVNGRQNADRKTHTHNEKSKHNYRYRIRWKNDFARLSQSRYWLLWVIATLRLQRKDSVGVKWTSNARSRLFGVGKSRRPQNRQRPFERKLPSWLPMGSKGICGQALQVRKQGLTPKGWGFFMPKK